MTTTEYPIEAAKGLKWKQLTEEEKAAVISSGRLDNHEDFGYSRVAGELYALDEDHAYLLIVPAEYEDAYPNFYFDGDDARPSRACLIPITTDTEPSEDAVCKHYIGVDPEHVEDFTVGF